MDIKLDILAIGVHPDDVELGCAGTIIKEIKAGRKIGIIDLTQGELGTRGNAEIRKTEAENAAQIMGVSIRENLKMRDGFFENDEENKLKLISTIRTYQPDIVIGNILSDRHPDHGRAGQLINDACFLSGLTKIITTDKEGSAQQKWRPKYCLQYIQDRYAEPDFIIDISDVFELKLQAIQAYNSQFFSSAYQSDEEQTYISSKNFLDAIKARNLLIGKKIGVAYGEGFITTKNIGLQSLSNLILNET